MVLMAMMPCVSHAQNIDIAIKCLASELDGSQTVRVTGLGKNRKDAKEQCKKNAVYAVIFMGIHAGECNTKPLAQSRDTRKRFQSFFDRFFMDGGEYSKYVNTADKKRWSNDKVRGKLEVHYEMSLRVLTSQLRTRLMEEGIIQDDYLVR